MKFIPIGMADMSRRLRPQAETAGIGTRKSASTPVGVAGAHPYRGAKGIIRFHDRRHRPDGLNHRLMSGNPTGFLDLLPLSKTRNKNSLNVDTIPSHKLRSRAPPGNALLLRLRLDILAPLGSHCHRRARRRSRRAVSAVVFAAESRQHWATMSARGLSCWQRRRGGASRAVRSQAEPGTEGPPPPTPDPDPRPPTPDPRPPTPAPDPCFCSCSKRPISPHYRPRDSVAIGWLIPPGTVEPTHAAHLAHRGRHRLDDRLRRRSIGRACRRSLRRKVCR